MLKSVAELRAVRLYYGAARSRAISQFVGSGCVLCPCDSGRAVQTMMARRVQRSVTRPLTPNCRTERQWRGVPLLPLIRASRQTLGVQLTPTHEGGVFSFIV